MTKKTLTGLHEEVAVMKNDMDYIKQDLSLIKQKIDGLPDKLDDRYANKAFEERVIDCEKGVKAIDLRMASIAGGVAVLALLGNHIMKLVFKW